ncbi:MAG TPA: putative sulfate exporter family transporter [Smithellaceae bacterium]|nr:putative sulfate exporter family transporter [Smithellaceae bacterium]HRS81841.1 putative sulfate exporter family transporter [Smithellaceae bacterium]HRV45609.1 putative sulfate exporter family transporter [Smithellaceae bacterium]
MGSNQGLLKTEDWWSVWLGLFIFILSLGSLVGLDLLGWAVTPKVWMEFSKSLAPASKAYAGLHPLISIILTYLAVLAVLLVGARALGYNLSKFIYGFTVIFWLTYICTMVGHYAVIAAQTPAEMKKFGLEWSLKLTGEAGLILALLVGLFIGNFMPKFADSLKEAARPEWFIKTAIVIMGVGLGVKSAEQLGLATSMMFRGLCAIIEAYLIYWAVVYLIARKFFKFSREWSAPLASGISICGVSASIATGGAIRARPIVPIMVSSLVVIFAVVELIILPFVATEFLSNQPLVAGAWMGLAVKTDGAAVASGQIVESLIYARNAAQGIHYQPGWVVGAATTVKIFIDIFIGIWAFILAVIWTTKINPKQGVEAKAGEIWDRFPKFVIGYFVTFLIMLIVGLNWPDIKSQLKISAAESDVFRKLFFALTFFSIGLASNFKKLWEEGIGKLMLVYIIALFGFIIWVGLIISWIFFQGVVPPLVQ